MTEGADVKDCFSQRFSDRFEYIDGFQSNVPYDLLTFACSTVLIVGSSSFGLLSSLLTEGVVLASTDKTKFKSLQNVIFINSATTAGDLRTPLHKLAPCR